MNSGKTDCPYLESSCNLEHCPCAKYRAWKCNPAEEMLKENLGVKSEDRLKTIFRLQKEFTEKVVSFPEMIKNKEHWIESYQICILDESAEVLQHIQWKHWKKRDPDKVYNIPELQKEFIDLVHFIVNMALVVETDSKFMMMLGTIKEFMTDDSCPLPMLSMADREFITLDLLVKISKNIFSIPVLDMEVSSTNVREALNSLLLLCHYWNMTGIDVYTMYIKKNAENVARQLNNY